MNDDKRLVALSQAKAEWHRQALYQDIVTDRLGERVRLEQERIDWGWAAERLPH